MRAAVVDIETSALDSVTGFIVCAVVQPLDKKPIVFRYDNLGCRPGKEKKLLRSIVNELDQYDLLIGHNFRKFDFNYIKSRCQMLGAPQPKRALCYDTMEGFKRCGYRTVINQMSGKPTASLAMICDFFGFEQEKTAIYPRAHFETVWENGKIRQEAIDNLVDHCIKDVRMTSKVYRAVLDADVNAVIKRLT